MDEDLASLSREQLIEEVRILRRGIRIHRDSTGHELCWHHPQLWGLLPEKQDPLPVVPAWPEFIRGCVRYRQSLDEQAPTFRRSDAGSAHHQVRESRAALAAADPMRAVVARLLDWEDAHAGFDKVVGRFPEKLRGKVPHGVPYSPWQLLEHLRLTQRDILDFCLNPAYEELHWPDDYWPKDASPPSPSAWDESVARFREDREALTQLALNTKTDLLDTVPAGEDQTYLRELLLVADHTAYHLGELVVVRRMLGVWPGS